MFRRFHYWVIGPNGAGKSTLIKMIAGLVEPDSGSLRLGETVKLGYADQSRTLDPELTVFQAITGGADNLVLGDMTVNGRAYCASFNFTGSEQQKEVKTLSGGEKNRVFLARTLTAGANVLLLDEPTNDLDVNTLERWKKRWRILPAARLWSAMTDGFWTHCYAYSGSGA